MRKVTYDDFLNEVKSEFKYFQRGTSWRKKVASLAVVIIHESNIRSVDYFLDKNAVIELVKDLLPRLCDDELIDDIGEFLSHIAKDLIIKANLSEEVNEYAEIQKRLRKGNPLRLKDKED